MSSSKCRMIQVSGPSVSTALTIIAIKKFHCCCRRGIHMATVYSCHRTLSVPTLFRRNLIRRWLKTFRSMRCRQSMVARYRFQKRMKTISSVGIQYSEYRRCRLKRIVGSYNLLSAHLVLQSFRHIVSLKTEHFSWFQLCENVWLHSISRFLGSQAYRLSFLHSHLFLP